MAVGVGVAVGVLVKVGVAVGVSVTVGVGVIVGVSVAVGTSVGEGVMVGVRVGAAHLTTASRIMRMDLTLEGEVWLAAGGIKTNSAFTLRL